MIFVSGFNTSFLLRNLAKNMCEFCLHNSCNSQSLTNNLSLGRVTYLHAFLAYPGSLDRILRQDFPVALPADVFFVGFFFFKPYNVLTHKPQNRLVDVCEKIQLQAQRIEKFIDQTLSVKEQKLQVRCDTQPTTLQKHNNSHTSYNDTQMCLLTGCQVLVRKVPCIVHFSGFGS